MVVIVLLSLAAHHKSPTKPSLSEWDACDRPLGAFNALWLVKVILGALLSFWSWQRGREANGTWALFKPLSQHPVAHEGGIQTSAANRLPKWSEFG